MLNRSRVWRSRRKIPGSPLNLHSVQKTGRAGELLKGGEQQIRIVFDQPVSLHRIQLRFHEAESERTQEFTLRWRSASGGPASEIVRQQWNFSPSGSSTEVEDYGVDLKDVGILELSIRPDLTRREEIATLASWRVG